jgi:hypothetical protein
VIPTPAGSSCRSCARRTSEGCSFPNFLWSEYRNKCVDLRREILNCSRRGSQTGWTLLAPPNPAKKCPRDWGMGGVLTCPTGTLRTLRVSAAGTSTIATSSRSFENESQGASPYSGEHSDHPRHAAKNAADSVCRCSPDNIPHARDN